MTFDTSSINETALAIQETFELNKKVDPEIDTQLKYAELKWLLTEKLRILIDQEFERFLNILYRIDVDENRVKKVFAEKPFDDAVSEVADLIIQRQMEKVITRKKYSKPGGDLEFDV